MKEQMSRVILFIFVSFLFGSLFGCSADIPKESGVYILKEGKYVEVVRNKDFKEVQYAKKYEQMLGRPWFVSGNLMSGLELNNVAQFDLESFNKDGFLVVKASDWSAVTLWSAKEDKERKLIVSFIDQYSIGNRKRIYEPVAVALKEIKKGENSYIYKPSAPVAKGYYLIDYSINGKGNPGYNPLLIN